MEPCTHHNCFAHEDATCALGHLNLATCPALKTTLSKTGAAPVQSDDVLLPWSGEPMGVYDLNFVTGRVKPTTVGIFGPESAGKTTVLGAWYLLLGRGLLGNPPAGFCGSYSLGGWEAVASSLRWEPGQKPTFPPHTTSRGGRAPGMLHLAFRADDGERRELIFADAPGEWFQKWAVDAASEEAEGARWIAEHADVVLLVADSEALSGAKMGTARSAFQLLAQRTAAGRRGRPVALVWTKADLPVNPAMGDRIRQAIRKEIPDAAEFSVSVFSKDGSNPMDGFQRLFDWVMTYRRPGVELPVAASGSKDPLFVYGRRSHG